MKVCYIDESGGFEAPDSSTDATPVMAMAAVIVDADRIPRLTRDFVTLKCKHFPAKYQSGQSLDHILIEVKGSQLLKMTRSKDRNHRRQARVFRDQVLRLLEDADARLLGRVWIKAPGVGLNAHTAYGYAMQDFAKHFSHLLAQEGEPGVIVADSREHAANRRVAHSIFTQKWKTGGDPYRPLVEVPFFAGSDNHAGIQLADLIASSFLFPMAVAGLAPPWPHGVHQKSVYEPVRDEFGSRVRELAYRYKSGAHRRGGIEVKNYATAAPASQLFTPPRAEITAGKSSA